MGFQARAELCTIHTTRRPQARKNPAAVGRRRAAGPQPPWGAARRRRTARGAGGRWAPAPRAVRRRAWRHFDRFPLLLSSCDGNPLSFRKSSFLHAHLSASAIPCSKLRQSPAILKIRNRTGKSTKLQELERKSPRFRCFSDFPRSCRFCFVSKISKPQQETHYMVWPTLINGRAGAER